MDFTQVGIKTIAREILRNVIKCNHCGDVIESKHRYDFKRCKCGCVEIDGGLEYLRRGFKNGEEDYEELSEFGKEIDFEELLMMVNHSNRKRDVAGGCTKEGNSL